MVPCQQPSPFTLRLNSKSYAEVKLPASTEFMKDAIVVAINKHNNMNSYAVNYNSQGEVGQVLIHEYLYHYL